MPDIGQPTYVAQVRPDDGRPQGQGRNPSGPPPKKVAETYGETAKAKPLDDRITILGIPAEQITPATQAALATLVAEVNFLRGSVRRLENAAARKDPKAAGDVLPFDILVNELGRAFAEPRPPDVARVLVLAYLTTFEVVRRSSGLLAANTLLADLAQRLLSAEFTAQAPAATAAPPPAHGPGQFRFRVVGYAGGSSLAGLAELPLASLDETHVARQVRDQLLERGFDVGGIEMAADVAVAAVVVSASDGGLTAIGRADHLLRDSGL
jgi:hypothetical protein